jgi:hypothetical protein
MSSNNKNLQHFKSRISLINKIHSFISMNEYDTDCKLLTVGLEDININPLKAELNPVCHLLILLGD